MFELFLTTKARKTNPPGFVFVCFCSSQRSNRRTLFHYFSINTTACSPSRDTWLILVRYHHAVKFKFIDYNNLLFYDCFYSGFSFNCYYNYTCRSRDRSIVGRKNCVSNCLSKYVADSNFLTLSTLDNNLTITCNY